MKMKNPDKSPARFLLACALALLVIPCARAQEVNRDDALRKKVEEVIGASGAETVGVAFYDLETKRELLINPDASFHAASTMKVPVMMEVFRQAHAGRLSLDASLDVHNRVQEHRRRQLLQRLARGRFGADAVSEDGAGRARARAGRADD